MADYERSTMVWVSPEVAFAFLADPVNLPDYVPVMTHAGTDADAGEAYQESDTGTSEAGRAAEMPFLADVRARRIEWGRPGSEYGGSIEVTDGVTDGTARVRIRLRTRDEAPRGEIEQLLDQAARNLLRRLSGR